MAEGHARRSGQGPAPLKNKGMQGACSSGST
jgi:hypothetical protein